VARTNVKHEQRLHVDDDSDSYCAGRKYAWPKGHRKQLYDSSVLIYKAELQNLNCSFRFSDCERKNVSQLFSDKGSIFSPGLQ